MINSTPSSQGKFYIRIDKFDCIWIILSPFIALGLRGRDYLYFGQLPLSPSSTLIYAVITILVTVFVFIALRVSEGITHLFSSRDALNILTAIMLSEMVTITVVFSISRLDGVPRSVPLIHGLVILFGSLIHRLTISSFQDHKYGNQSFIRNATSNIIRHIIIVGLDPFAISAIRLTQNQRPVTVKILAAYSLQEKYIGRSFSSIKILANLYQIGSIVDEFKVHGIKVDEIWVSDSSQFYNNSIADFLQTQTKDRGVITKKLSEALNLAPIFDKSYDDAYLKNPEIHINYRYIYIKRFLDVVGAICLIVILWPIVLVAALSTIINIGFPITFWQERVGKNGKLFRLYKIRTLNFPIGADGHLRSDVERLSSIGMFMRRFRIDEMPQLVNVIAGEMSGIGPRPLLPRDQPHNSYTRLLVRPGITGWAQVNGGELLLPEEKNALDCWYIYHMSIFLDIKIVFISMAVLIKGIRRNEREIERAMNWAKEIDLYKISRNQ
jgi:lipopolysaccharide/colanic/teichoic acid biosynthesis glycosyltransferase